MDTGSDVFWVQCLPCVQCSHRPQPIFDPAHSSSYTDIPCNSLAYNLLPKKNSRAGHCLYDIAYGDGSYSMGNLALENLALGDLLIKKFALGFSHSNNGNFGETGIMDLGHGMFSIQNKIGYLIGGGFTFCLPSRGGGLSRSLVLGRDVILVNAAWAPLLSNAQAPSFYYVRLVGLRVNGIRLPVSDDIFQITKSGHGGVIMDTGTTVTRFPKLVYEAFRDAYIAQNPSLPQGLGVEILDLCYDSEL
ncbi:hypothetical protein SO802_028406 [Lithocarpus litseifolius]|uniref:Peptidase A1 domain-containing protein n=1 Tax=Lithocarpus litseifolius TaxID=425828 RepID=A0AAW2BQS2_9ROSI